MKYSTVTVSSREGDYVGTVEGFTRLPDLGLFARRADARIELIATGDSSSTLITISE